MNEPVRDASRYPFFPSETEKAAALRRKLIDDYCPVGFCYWGAVPESYAKAQYTSTDYVTISETVDLDGKPHPGSVTVFRRIGSIPLASDRPEPAPH